MMACSATGDSSENKLQRKGRNGNEKGKER